MSGLVVDTSAMVAILGEEAGAEWLSEQLSSAERRIAAAPTVVELAIVLEARAPAAVGIARRALRDAGVEVVPFDDDLADRAAEAWRRFGRGRHLAALNLGDCFTYALAHRTNQPVLCVRDDFAQTDLRVVRPPG
ncbi:MAG: type II toxin-antitoxin system VapC family toxin [Actinomycetota bacterium]|nr:type II toxin-antitoxin system VapC family toxin [Actinomycetota bacterium]